MTFVLTGHQVEPDWLGSDLSSLNGTKVSYSFHVYNLDEIFTGDVLLLE
jgi:hypothetical protein